MLRDVGIDRRDCWFTYSIPFLPEVGYLKIKDIADLCVPKKEYEALCQAAGYRVRPPLAAGKYVPPDLYPYLHQLGCDLEELSPTVIIPLGPFALWALTGSSNLDAVRGTVVPWNGRKLLPTYSPGRILAQWSNRVVALVDLQKAKREMAFREVKKPARSFWIDPSIEDLYLFQEIHMNPATEISIDIECLGGFISMIGISPDPSVSLVVPFVDTRQPDLSYWRTHAEEVLALRWIKTVLQSKLVKITQNGLFDFQWIWKKFGFAPRGPYQDTMIRHHTMQPELKKGLGFLGSVYTNEASWKLMRKRAGEEGEKADE